MKTSLLVLLAILTSGLAFGEESLLIPSVPGEWSASPGATATGEQVLVAEAESGHFYQFSPQAKDGKTGTKVYHSTNAKDFGADSKYRDALYLVASLPLVVEQVIKRDGQWYLTAQRPGVEGRQEARLTWKTLAPAVPNVRQGPNTKVRVALYDDSGSAGKGVPSCEAQVSAAPGMEVTKLSADGIRAGLSGYDVVIFSGGSGSKQASTIGLVGREQVRRFVNAGGGYVGICAGAYLACSGFS